MPSLQINTFSKVHSLISILLSLSLAAYPSTSALGKNKPLRDNRPASLYISESFGVNYSFPDPHPKAEHLEMLSASGVRWVRMDMSWASMEKTKGQYDFAAYDNIFNGFAKYNLRPLVILGSHGQTNYPNRSGQYPHPPDTPEAQQAFTNWVVAVIQRYKGRGFIWEVYNEPNNKYFWPPQPNAQDYSNLALMVGKAAQQVAPNETFIGPAIVGTDLTFLEEVLKSGVLAYWDGISVHPYRSSDMPETVSKDYFKFRQLIRKYKSSNVIVPLISGEWGYPSTTWEGTFFDEEKQSRFLARQWLINLQNRIPISIWFSWCDGDCLTGKSNDTYDHFGLVRSPGIRSRNVQQTVNDRRKLLATVKRSRAAQKGSIYRPSTRGSGLNPRKFALHRTVPRTTAFEPKPSYFAARTLTTLFKGYSYDRQLKVAVPDVYLLRFRPPRKNRNPGFAAWSTSSQPKAVTLPLPSGNYQVTSHLGDDLEIVSSQSGLVLELTDAPLYLVKK
jgi:polysaccharide biosynthesis protein PslG